MGVIDLRMFVRTPRPPDFIDPAIDAGYVEDRSEQLITQRGGIMLFTKEHYDLLNQFEKNFKHLRLDREQSKELWAIGRIYENGETNQLFLAYRLGYAFGKAE